MAYAYKRVDTPTELEITEEAFFSEKSLLSSVEQRAYTKWKAACFLIV